MKNLRQSRMLKAVAVVLLFFSMVSIPVSVVGEAYLADKYFNYDYEEMFSGEYKDSAEFSELFSKRIGQLAEYIRLKNVLETDGELDYERVVCHMTAAGQVDFTESKGYTIGELIKANHFFVEDIDSQDQILLDELFENYKQKYAYVPSEHEAAILSETDEPNFIKDFYNDSDWLLVEDCEEALDIMDENRHVDQDGIMIEENYAVDSQMRMEVWETAAALDAEKKLQLQVPEAEAGLPANAYWVFTPADLSYRYTYYVSYYLYYQGLFDNPGEQRFVYEVSNGMETFTNSEGIEPYRTNNVRTAGSLYYTSSGYTVKTDVENVRRDYVDNLETALTVNGGEADIYVTVTEWSPDVQQKVLPEEAFTRGERQYMEAQKLSVTLFIIGMAGVFGVLILGFYLIASAGHAKDVEGVRLTWFDKWYTEPAAVICSLVLTCAVIAEIEIIVEARELSFILLAAGGAVVCYLTGMFSAASLLRRIKAGTIWRNSFLRNGGRWLIRSCKRFFRACHVIYEERDTTVRVIIVYAMVLAATVITGALVMISLFEGSMLVLFFMLLFVGIHGGTLYMLLRDRIDYKRIVEGVERMADGDLNYKVDEMGMQTDNRRMAVAANRVGDGLAEAVEKSIKNERMKTDLITNVSHDIKTPLTSIINYVDLLKREKIEDEKISSYIDVLDSKSQRLKNLTDDLVEASKLSSGNVVLTMQEINLVELVHQANGEFMEKFALKNLTIIPTLPDNPVIIEADGRRLWRVLENLYNNVSKYAMENTRVYVTVVPEEGRVSFVMKNISASPLNIKADELTERFIRGDVSRSTEGSGLGLSIARSLTELMKGTFEIYLDGDLFRVTVTFMIK